MKISTRSRYGLRLLIELARHPAGKPVSLGEISKNQRISEKYLSMLVISLRGAGLIESVRGARGGYVLARPPGKINLREIIDALEGANYVIKCADDPRNCSNSRICVARWAWGGLEKAMRDYCESLTLDEIVRKGPPGISLKRVGSIRLAYKAGP